MSQCVHLCVRFTAAILCIYLVGLLLQPTLFTLHTKPVMSCCSKETHKKAKHACCPGTDTGGCCDFGSCNPFFSQCPICAATCVTPSNLEFKFSPPFESIAKQKFFSYDQYWPSDFHSDLLRPPAFVC